MALRLLEHEVKDVRSVLADLPTAVYTIWVTGKDEFGEEHTIDADLASLDVAAVDVVTLMERLGEIYDVARARAIRESLVASTTANR